MLNRDRGLPATGVASQKLSFSPSFSGHHNKDEIHNPYQQTPSSSTPRYAGVSASEYKGKAATFPLTLTYFRIANLNLSQYLFKFATERVSCEVNLDKIISRDE